MLRQAKNELTMTVTITGKSPLMTKDGRWKNKEMGDRTTPTMIFLSRTPEGNLIGAVKSKQLGQPGFEYYIPGASIRGAWRSHLEKALRSLDGDPKICDPLIPARPSEAEAAAGAEEEAPGPYAACSRHLVNRDERHPLHAYRDSCPVCQLFGNTAQGSRISFGDASKIAGQAVDVVNNAISRQTGAAITPFSSRVIVNAVFEFELQLRNFELWHVGLLAHLFEDLQHGLVRLGAGKSKGWGRCEAAVSEMSLTYFGLADPWKGNQLLGIAELMDPAELARYGMTRTDEPPALPALERDPASSLWRHAAKITDPGAFWTKSGPCFNKTVWGLVSTLAAKREAARSTPPAAPGEPLS